MLQARVRELWKGREFDQVASLRVEGVSISATARLTGPRNTVARWLERTSAAAERFNRRMLRGFELVELQADEVYAFIGSKSKPTWLFATIEVCSRLWAGSLLGRRPYRNTKAALNDVILRGRLVGFPLVATDGFEYYFWVIRCLMGHACASCSKTQTNSRSARRGRFDRHQPVASPRAGGRRRCRRFEFPVLCQNSALLK